MPGVLPPIPVMVPGGRDYEVRFDALATLPEHLARVGLAGRSVVVVTDAHVAAHYLAPLRDALVESGHTVREVVVEPGEGSKSLATLAAVYDAALAAPLERSDVVVALGGGVVGDLAGFAAATLLRGLPLVHVPTSVIAQVDSSIGGKTGINRAQGKNLIGAFWPPLLVLADTATLATLPEREFRSGLAEVVKHALLDGPGFVAWLDTHWERIAAREAEVVTELVRRAVAVKAAVVSADEREAGARAFLNLGHTFGHAVEKAAGYGTYTHGEAVALGLRAALHLSAALAAGRSLPPDEPLPPPFDRADALAARLPIPRPLDVPQAALNEALGTDKKRERGAVRYVVLDAHGRPRLTSDVPPDFVSAAWARARYVTGASSGSVTVT